MPASAHQGPHRPGWQWPTLLPLLLLTAGAVPALGADAGPDGGPEAGLDAEAPIEVLGRLEGKYAPLWSGWVTLDGHYTFTAQSGRVHTEPARTPLGAAHAAAQAAGTALTISDEFDDATLLAVAGEEWWGTWWWDYRVNSVQTTYGPQEQWLAWGPALQEGDEVVWYPETLGSVALRLTKVGPALTLPGSGCAQAVAVDELVVDVPHQPGQAWPAAVWGPAALSRLGGASKQTVAGGGTLAAVETPGPVWAEEHPLVVEVPHHPIRSGAVDLTCRGGPGDITTPPRMPQT